MMRMLWKDASRAMATRRRGRKWLLVHMISLGSFDCLLLACVSGVYCFKSQGGKRYTTATHLPPSIADDFMLRRTVGIRQVSWAGDESLLQIYKGASVPPAKNAFSKKRIQNLVQRLNDGDDLSVAAKGFPKLSHSSIVRLQNWQTLTDVEKKNVELKVAAEARALQPVLPSEHLHILYMDDDICVVNKPSGILSVPGPRRNPSLLEAVYDTVRPSGIENMDQMVVHRLDMATSGILVFALSLEAVRRLHDDFRSRRVQKCYEAVVAGHISVETIEIDVSLERDPYHPPFMRIQQPRDDDKEAPGIPTELTAKFIKQAPKPSYSVLNVKQRFGLGPLNLPVTRVELVPHTGRTHQLRVHAACIGYPIVGDDIYGWAGEGDCGGLNNHHLNPLAREQHRQIRAMETPLFLHAYRLSIFHPISGEPMVFECAPPF